MNTEKPHRQRFDFSSFLCSGEWVAIKLEHPLVKILTRQDPLECKPKHDQDATDYSVELMHGGI